MRHKQNFSSACSTRRRRTRRVAIVFQSVSIAMLLCCKTAICLMARLHEKIDIIDALFHSHTPQHFACREIGYISEPCFSLSPATKLLNRFSMNVLWASCLLAMNLRLYGIHIFRFPDLTCTVRQSCWHFEYRTTIPLLYTSKRCIAYSDEIVTTYPVDACAIVTFHDK